MTHDGWLPHPNLAPDGAPAECVLASLRSCAGAWAPQACLMGNVRARDIVRAIDEVQERLTGPRTVPEEALPGGEWSAEALVNLAQRLRGLTVGDGDGGEDARALADARRLIESLAAAAAARPYEDVLPPVEGRPAGPRL